MICYRDMTFCPFHTECKNGYKCGRALTDKIQSKAKTFGLPICQFSEPPECHKRKESDVQN